MSMLFSRGVVSVQSRLAARGEEGQAVAEYGTVMLVAVALGMAVLALFTKGGFDTVLHTLTEKALKLATNLMG
jgi:hypothetical protein